MNWLHYLLEANLYLMAFYIGYYLFLSHETHYTLNRSYLLISSLLAFVIPLVQLGFIKPVEKQVTVVRLQLAGHVIAHTQQAPVAIHITWQDALIAVYIIGVIILLTLLLIKLYQLSKLIRTENTRPGEQYKLVYINELNTAFSFFNFLFIGTQIEGADTIIKHELVHIRQKHSADIIFIELLKIINWFNPFIYLLQHSLKAVHEYIADEKTAADEQDAIAYSSFLVNNAYGLGGSSITHSFFNYNLLKKRIIMLNQKRSGNLARLKYLLAIPLCAGLLCASTLAFSKDYGWIKINAFKPTDTVRRVSKTQNNVSDFDNAYTTTKGYKIHEHVKWDNNVVSKKVTITEKDGSENTYDGKNLSAADLKMLQDKYGYKFPEVNTKTKITTIKLIPPPPTPAPPKNSIDNRPPPPPPAPPVPSGHPVPHVAAKTQMKPQKSLSEPEYDEFFVSFGKKMHC